MAVCKFYVSFSILLSFVQLSFVIKIAHGLRRPTKAVSESFASSLVSNTLPLDGPFLGDNPSTSVRVSRDGTPEPVCGKELFSLGRSMTVMAMYNGPEDELAYVDSNFGFFKFALGWDDEQIEESRLRELRMYKKLFAVDATTAKQDKETGAYVTPNGRRTLAPVVFNVRLAKVSDSDKLVPCRNVTAVIGGWLLYGENVSYGGDAMQDGKRVRIPGESSVLTLYIVFSPGSTFSTKIECRSSAPGGCIAGSCPLVTTTELVDGFHEPYIGSLAGVILEKVDGKNVKVDVSWVLSWPERA